MQKLTFLMVMVFGFIVSCNESPDTSNRTEDIIAIKQNIEDYDQGWDAKDLETVLKGYSNDIDWTNAFGDRVQGKEELRELLEIIFSLDFVMSGKNNYKRPDINFLTNEIALVRSTNIRTGQQWPDGSAMNDRVINHLRVFEKRDDTWLCINHMISQAHDKEGN
ncbi:SgcJ/EcaC family oxidoreductase [Winogradskyella sp. SYSU M77433]|uniref:YybH family protein n=1 Tax=Winogradskyella sp. SYSU M77433 TaxID=3042722 RepID=UPI0024815022|nr:SgcJ/EcaC family oxidoreductase [Winogradskyella sp. SYSU M77433]MDH7912505.1 SgcJ/EcaC family oxidoreductase [Winogradskyella sp. SYSU M77433]